MIEWRTIDSAPRDETDILVWGPLHDQMVVQWADNSSGRKLWMTLDGLGYGEVFTHWMPLPPPPGEPG